MLLRRSLATLLGALMLLAGISEAKAEEVTFGTLAPKKSPWGKVFDVWATAVAKKTGGKGTIKWYYNGTQGDEKAMIAKIRSGQLDGAACTSVGLSDIHKPFLALQMPGLIDNWATLDRVRDAVMPDLQRGANAAGFVVLGKGDVGLAHTMSKNKPIKAPKDLKTMKVYQWSDDIIAPVTASVIGYTGVKSSVPGLLPKLSSGQINVITVPALAATQLQWWSHLNKVNENVAGAGIGGLIVSKSKLDSLDGDFRSVLKDTGAKAGTLLTKRIRSEDEKAYKMISSRMKVVKLNAMQEAKWKSVFKKVRRRLGQGTFSPAFVKKLEDLAGK